MMTEYADDEDRPFLLRWLPVLTLTLCVFVFNTSEFIPIGLLTDIGRDFDRTEAETGWLVTAYAWIVAVMSLPLMLLASRTECRRLMMTVVGLFVASHVLSAAAGSATYVLLYMAKTFITNRYVNGYELETVMATVATK